MAVLVSPLKAEQDRFPFHSPTALVSVTDPSNQARVAPEDLARVYRAHSGRSSAGSGSSGCG